MMSSGGGSPLSSLLVCLNETDHLQNNKTCKGKDHQTARKSPTFNIRSSTSFVFYNSFFRKSVTILSICKQRFISCGSQLNSGEMIWNWLVCNFLSSRYIAIILQQRNVLTKQFGNHFHLNRFKLKHVRLRFKDKAPAYTELCSREG